MADFKNKIRDLMNQSQGLNDEKLDSGKMNFRVEFINKESRNQSKNDTDLFSKSMAGFNWSKSKNSQRSPMRNTLSHLSTNNESKNNLFELNSISTNLKKSTRQNEKSFITGIPTVNRKQEFYKLKYSDLLGKKVESTAKVNKYMKLLMNDLEKNNSANNGNNNLTSYDTIKCNTTKNKFMNEILLFSQTLKLGTKNQKISMNKPEVNIKIDVNLTNYFAFSPTNKKSLSHSNLFKTDEQPKDKYISMLQTIGYNSKISKTKEKSKNFFLDYNQTKGNASTKMSISSRISNQIL